MLTSSAVNKTPAKISEIEESITTTFNEFLLLEEHWNRFLNGQCSSYLCVEWSWIINWLDVYLQKDDTLFVCTYWLEGQLVGVMPCYLKKARYINELRFIATGEDEVDEVCSEFQDFIVENNYKDEIFTKFTAVILKHAVKKMSFENILPNSNIHSWIESLNHISWMFKEKKNGFRYCVELSESKDLIGNIPGKTLRRKMRSAQKANMYEIELLEKSTNFDDYYHALIINHQSVWKEKGKIGAFNSNKFTEFHKSYAQVMLSKKQLVMFKLTYQHKVLAVFYGLISGDVLYYYQSGIKRIEGHNNIGAAMHYYALDFACKRGFKQYDLMRGSLDSYKQQYCTPSIPTSNIYIIRRTLCYIPILKSIVSFIKASIKRVI
jgi:CelD/BcsL family acetyltransferase involved in cellulose biosynthesis